MAADRGRRARAPGRRLRRHRGSDDPRARSTARAVATDRSWARSHIIGNGRTILPNQEAFMRSHILTVAVLIVVSAGMGSAVLSAAGNPVAAGQEGRADAQKYLGAWAGSYTSDGGATNKVSFT